MFYTSMGEIHYNSYYQWVRFIIIVITPANKMVESVMNEKYSYCDKTVHTKNIRGDCDNSECTTDYCSDDVLHLDG